MCHFEVNFHKIKRRLKSEESLLSCYASQRESSLLCNAGWGREPKKLPIGVTLPALLDLWSGSYRARLGFAVPCQWFGPLKNERACTETRSERHMISAITDLRASTKTADDLRAPCTFLRFMYEDPFMAMLIHNDTEIRCGS